MTPSDMQIAATAPLPAAPTPRDDQRRLLELLGAGFTLEEAAHRLHISRRTAQRRLEAVRVALAARSTCHAVVLVLVDGDREGERPPERLSPRERQVLLLVGSGLTSEEAAADLGIRRNTVDSLVRTALGKLDARTRTQAAVLAALAERQASRPARDGGAIEDPVEVAPLPRQERPAAVDLACTGARRQLHRPAGHSFA